MTKEEVIKWLLECSDEGDGASCVECPFGKCEDCAGELMAEAAMMLAGEEG